MTTYSLLNFLHVVSSIGIIVAISFERLMMTKLLKATTSEQFRVWKDLHALPLKIGGPSVVISLLTGIYLAVTMWPQTPWIWPAIVALGLVAVAGTTLTNVSHKALLNASSARDLGPVWRRLWLSLQFRIGLLVGILFLMVVKPPLRESVAALVVWALIFAVPAAFFKKKYQPVKI